MRRFLPSPRRLRTILGAGAVGVVAAAAFATPAFACHGGITATSECGTTPGTIDITWTLTLRDNTPAGGVLSEVVQTPGTLKGGIKNDATLTESGLTAIQTVPSSVHQARIDGKLTWTFADKHGKLSETKWEFKEGSNVATFPHLKCDAPPSTPPSATPSATPTKPPASKITFTSDCTTATVTIENPSKDARKFEVTGRTELVTVAAGGKETVVIAGDKLTGGTVEVWLVEPKGKEQVGSSPWKPTPCDTASPTGSVVPSGVAGASSSAAGSLPVTGANIALISGAAILLVGAGAGLFMVARRRRVRFTA